MPEIWTGWRGLHQVGLKLGSPPGSLHPHLPILDRRLPPQPAVEPTTCAKQPMPNWASDIQRLTSDFCQLKLWPQLFNCF